LLRGFTANFTCEQVTNRSVDPHGSAQWQPKDEFTERLTYLDHDEDLTLLEHKQISQTGNSDNGALKGVLSFGEFGNAIASLFRPASKADFNGRKRANWETERSRCLIIVWPAKTLHSISA
jgi:hypothetical protein